MPLDPVQQAIADATPGNDSDVADLLRRVRALERAAAKNATPVTAVGGGVAGSASFAGVWGNKGGGYAACGYRRDEGGWIELEGVAAKGTPLVQGETIYQLPSNQGGVDYRPAARHVHMAYVDANGITAVMFSIVETDGRVTSYGQANQAGAGSVASYVLDGCRFRGNG